MSDKGEVMHFWRDVQIHVQLTFFWREDDQMWMKVMRFQLQLVIFGKHLLGGKDNEFFLFTLLNIRWYLNVNTVQLVG